MITPITNEIRQTLLAGLDRLRSDDLERARSGFRSLTPAQMQEAYGESGQTRQQILDGYEEHAARVERAKRFVEELA